MGFFDDVTSIVINNKEVQSIITSDGGVIYEKPTGYELTLTSDKSIIQTGETCNLTATLTNNNVPMANQTIVFNGLEYTETLEANTEITVGDTYRFTSIPSLSSSDRIYLNEEQTIYITSDRMGNKELVINGEAPYEQQYLDFFYVENGIIYYQRINDILRHYDASSTNTNKITSTVSNVVIEEYAKAVTDANGVASVGYYGKGTGDLSIQADWEGRIQSEIFVIEDCLFFDNTLSNNLSQYAITNYGSSFDTDHYVLSNTANYNLNFLKIPLTDLTDFILEADMKVAIRGDLGNFGLMVTKASEISSSGITNNRTELMDYTTTFGMYVEGRTVTGHFIDNQYYTLRYTIKSDGTIKAEIIDTIDGRTVFYETVDGSSKISYLKECYIHSRGKTSTIHIKDLKIKPL